MQDPDDTTAAPASNVLPLFGKTDHAGRRVPLTRSESWQTAVDNIGFVRHDASASSVADVSAQTSDSKRASPMRRHAMPGLALEAMDPDGLDPNRVNVQPWTSPPSPVSDWNLTPNHRRAAKERRSCLTCTLETDIIPRLVVAHRSTPSEPAPNDVSCRSPSTRDVEDFVQLVLAREHVPAQAFVNVLSQRGMSVETIYLDLLAPAAQYLNYLWTQDLCEFTQVTLGLARMQRLLHELSAGMGSGERAMRSNARRVLLMPACGEHQTLGLSMVAEFFHHMGWEVDCGGGQPEADAVDIVRAQWFDVLGISAGSDTSLDRLRRCIGDVRQASRNPKIGVLVGGPIFAGHSERVKFVGADTAGLDGKKAPEHAERLIALRASKRSGLHRN